MAKQHRRAKERREREASLDYSSNLLMDDERLVEDREEDPGRKGKKTVLEADLGKIWSLRKSL